MNRDPVPVEIYGQVYHLRGPDPVHIRELAKIVDGKMRAVSAQGATVDSLRVAVLASLNIADELAMLRERYNELAERHRRLSGSVAAGQNTARSRSASLAGMLDELLETATEPVSRRVG